jgi:hypothetical protein
MFGGNPIRRCKVVFIHFIIAGVNIDHEIFTDVFRF